MYAHVSPPFIKKKNVLVILMWEEVLNLTIPAKLEYASKLGAKKQTVRFQGQIMIYTCYIL